MSDIAPISRTATTYTPAGRAASSSAPAPSSTRGDDRVELSSAAQMLAKLRETPGIREDVVDRVRNEIAAGTYETDDKIDASVDALLKDLA